MRLWVKTGLINSCYAVLGVGIVDFIRWLAGNQIGKDFFAGELLAAFGGFALCMGLSYIYRNQPDG